MRVLITGVTGFAGSHLADLCLAKGTEVWGVKRWRSDTSNIDHILDKINLADADLTDPAAVRYALDVFGSPEPSIRRKLSVGTSTSAGCLTDAVYRCLSCFL